MKFVAIRENHLFSKAYSKGKKCVCPSVAVYVLPDYSAKRLAKAHPLGLTVNRIGLTVSKKIGGAVVRSRTKRILREGLRSLEKNSSLKKGFLIVIAARERARGLKSTDIEKELETAFARLGMFAGRQEREK